MARKLYTYQWSDGDLTFLMASDRGEAFACLDQLGDPSDMTGLRRLSDDRLFTLTLRVDAAGRLVLANDVNNECDTTCDVLDSYGMRPPLLAMDERIEADDEDDEHDSAARERLEALHEQAETLAIEHVRSRLSEEELTALDARLPSTLQREQRRKELEAELAMPLPQLKAHLKTAVKRHLKDFAAYIGGDAPGNVEKDIRRKFKEIDAMTASDQARGQEELRRELAELDPQDGAHA